MKKRTTLICAAIGAAATLAGVFPQQTPATGQDTVTPVAQTKTLKPQYATTANSEITMTVDLTQEQIGKARDRVKANKPLEKPKQTSKRPADANRQSGKTMTLADAYKQAADSVKEAHAKPYKDFGKGAQTATAGDGSKMNMSLAASYDLNESTVGYPVGTTPPATLEALCFGGTAEFDAVIDRFTACGRTKLIAKYYEVDSKTGAREYMGTNTGIVQLYTQQYNIDRSTRMFAKMQKDSVTYDWGWWDNIWTAPGVDLTVIGNCFGNTLSCSATGSPITLTWENWNSIDTWYNWNAYSKATYGVGRDKLGAHGTHVEFYTDTGDYSSESRASLSRRLVRCDSATYIYADWQQGCVFLETIPRIMYSRAADSPHKGVADHIYKAQNQPDSTYPTSAASKSIPGKYVAGDYYAAGLHRLHENFHLTTMNANTSHKDQACTSTGEYSTTGLPLSLRPEPGVEDCDEYPFRSTLEGAASQAWDFSVYPVDLSQNRSAGNTLMNYVRNHRILAWDDTLPDPANSNDRYYVQIVDF